MGLHHKHRCCATFDGGNSLLSNYVSSLVPWSPGVLVPCVSMSPAYSWHQKGLGGIPKDAEKKGRVGEGLCQ